MIIIRGYHGSLDKNRAQKLDAIATVIQPTYEWNFDGTVATFSELWDEKFLYLPCPDGTKYIFVTFRSSFATA